METTSPCCLHRPNRSAAPAWRRTARLSLVAWREWLIFMRYPTWIIALFIWPVIFPAVYILTARALAGPDGSGLSRFLQTAGTDNFLGYIVVGTTVWMWQNIVLWNVGFALRGEQCAARSNPTGSSPPGASLFCWAQPDPDGHHADVHRRSPIWSSACSLACGSTAACSACSGGPGCDPILYGIGLCLRQPGDAAREANTFVFLVRGLVMIFCGITYPLGGHARLDAVGRRLAAANPHHPRRARRRAHRLLAPAAILDDLTPPAPLRRLLADRSGTWLFTLMDRRARRTGAIGQY